MEGVNGQGRRWKRMDLWAARHRRRVLDGLTRRLRPFIHRGIRQLGQPHQVYPAMVSSALSLLRAILQYLSFRPPLAVFTQPKISSIRLRVR